MDGNVAVEVNLEDIDYDQKQWNRLKRSADGAIWMKDQDWRGKDLFGWNFSDVILERVNMNGCGMHHSKFDRALLKKCSCQQTRFVGVLMTNMIMEECSCIRANFYNCNFTGSILQNNDFTKVQYDDSVFDRVQLNGEAFTEEQFINSGYNEEQYKKHPEKRLKNNLCMEAIVQGLGAWDVYLKNKNKSTSWYGPIKYMDLKRLDLTDYDFGSLHMEGMNFKGCDFTRTNFGGCYFTNCNFNQCTFRDTQMGVNYTNCIFDGSKFDGTKGFMLTFINCTFRRATIDWKAMKDVELHHVNFTDAKVDWSQLIKVSKKIRGITMVGEDKLNEWAN